MKMKRQLKKLVMEMDLALFFKLYEKYNAGPGSVAGSQSELAVDLMTDDLFWWKDRAWAEYMERQAKGYYQPGKTRSIKPKGERQAVVVPVFDADEIAEALGKAYGLLEQPE